MGAIYIIGALMAFVLGAYILGVRDARNAEKRLIAALKKNWGNSPKREYKADDLDHLKGYYDNHREGFQIDDTTWNDLNMDGVFSRMNYCLSATGEEYLYYMLRTPKQDNDFEEAEKKIRFFSENNEARIKSQVTFGKIGRGSRFSVYDYLQLLEGVQDTSNAKHYAMLAAMAVSLVLCFVSFGLGLALFICLACANIIMYFSLKGKINPYIATYAYVLKMLSATKYFNDTKYPEISDDIKEMEESCKRLKSFSSGSGIVMSTSGMSSGNPGELIIDYVRILTHLDIIKFNKMYRELMDKRADLDNIITVMGRLEAYISIACYRESVKNNYCIPDFSGKGIEADDMLHPLIENAVANSIHAKNGVLLTGSNASGKSTFLKMVGINAVLAQSIHTVLAKSYKAPLFRVYSSMALKDDIYEGDSYYIVEIKSMKRIIDAAANEGNPVLCFVDEVLRGTNTIERIAASTEMLKYLTKAGVNCFAATHDIELTVLLKGLYDFYHFEGDVSDNDVHFDYKIKEGPATNRNAIKLLSVLGYDNNLVDDAQKLADKFLTTGVWE